MSSAGTGANFDACWVITKLFFMLPTTLLFIDDDEDDLGFFYQAIKEIDRNIHCFLHKDSESAMQLLEQDLALRPDLIFLDLNMPKLSGKHCLAMIKKMARHKHTPVIICTTSSAETDMDETWELGAACYLTKPPTVHDWKYELNEVLTAFLNESYVQPALRATGYAFQKNGYL